jgi:NRPS condensation-like uncharacterized protein
MAKKKSYWTPLDNAAKIYPAIRSKDHTAVFRLTVILKERINIMHLFKALDKVEKRFPYFVVNLKKGFFWYYLEGTEGSIGVKRDDGALCRAFNNRNENKLLLRILVYQNQISAEISHILTDGFGLSQLLKTLLIYYFRERGVVQKNQIDSFYKVNGDPEEIEDAYNRYFKENIPTVISPPKAFHLPFRIRSSPKFDVLFAVISIDNLREKAKEKEVSITDFLVAVYLMVLQDIFFESKASRNSRMNEIARIQVPVNLRNILPSKTMRNFSLYLMPELDFRLGHYDFNEVLKIVYHKMKLETDEKFISKIISRNVGSERNLFVRTIPIWIKSLILYMKFYKEGANQYSGVVTNLGKIDLPEAISDKIELFAVTPPPPNKKLKINCGVVGYQDKLVLSFGNITNSKEFEMKYLRFLVQQGVRVSIKKNNYCKA